MLSRLSLGVRSQSWLLVCRATTTRSAAKSTTQCVRMCSTSVLKIEIDAADTTNVEENCDMVNATTKVEDPAIAIVEVWHTGLGVLLSDIRLQPGYSSVLGAQDRTASRSLHKTLSRPRSAVHNDICVYVYVCNADCAGHSLSQDHCMVGCFVRVPLCVSN